MSSLNQALQLHRSGDVPAAAAIYERVLSSEPRNADALGLLGLAAYQTGDLDRAIELIGRAVEIAGDKPFLLNNLGLALAARGDFHDAVATYRRGLAPEPNNPDLQNNLSLALQNLGEMEAALAASNRAVKINPDHPEYQHNRGVLMQVTGRLGDAIRAYEKALDVHPTPETLVSLASALDELGEREAAIGVYKRAIELDPLHDAALDGLRWILWDMDRADAIEAVHRQICQALPRSTTARRQFGQVLVDAEKPADAVEVLTEALELDPEDAGVRSQLARALMQLDRLDEALEQSAAAVRLDDRDALIHEVHAEVLMRAGKLADAADTFLAADQRPGRRSSILANLTIALNELEDPRLGEVVDYDQFVTTRKIATPEGHADLDTFNEALHAELAARHVDRPPPIGQTMRGGTQIRDNLFANPTGLVQQLRREINRAIAAYLEDLEPDPAHPFLRNARRQFRFTGAWSTILGGDGYDGNHIHNEGWMSGVYYVKVPPLDAAAWERGEGCIQFGEPPPRYASERNRTRRLIRPEPGMLVLFPSYYWHGVRPFHERGQERHSIAFDVM